MSKQGLSSFNRASPIHPVLGSPSVVQDPSRHQAAMQGEKEPYYTSGRHFMNTNPEPASSFLSRGISLVVTLPCSNTFVRCGLRTDNEPKPKGSRPRHRGMLAPPSIPVGDQNLPLRARPFYKLIST
jgi:hypothetical protein